jgi:hypothetical protein
MRATGKRAEICSDAGWNWTSWSYSINDAMGTYDENFSVWSTGTSVFEQLFVL